MAVVPVFRLARAVVFATVCVTLGVVGHVLASHGPVPLPAVAGGLGGVTVVAVVLAGTERSLATILGGLLGGQFGLHALFAAAQHGQDPHGHLAPVAGHGGRAMTLAHVLAAVASAWWLRRGERAVWRLASRVAATAIRPLRALLAAPGLPRTPRFPPGGSGTVPRPAARVLRHVVTRRGPPSPRTALAESPRGVDCRA